MSTAKSVGGNIKGLKDTIEVLKLAFPNLSSAIINVITALKSGEGAASAFKVSLAGIGNVIKAHPIITAITAVVAFASAISLANKKAEEARQKANQKAQETIANNKQEQESLESLVEQYKELSKNDRNDSSNRESIKKVQDEITTLVGKQAENLDLVNGKLDEELAKINEIYKTSAENSTSSYRRALNATEEAFDDNRNEWQNQGNKILWWNILPNQTISLKDMDSTHWTADLKKDLERIVKEYDGSVDGGLDFVLNLPKAYGDRLEVLNKVIETYESHVKDYKNDKIWKGLTDAYNRISELVDDSEIAAQDLLNNLINREYRSKKGQDQINSIDNLDDYIEYRQNLINILSNDSDIKDSIENGLLNKDFISKQADDFLSTLPEVSKYYNQWYDKFASDTVKGVQKVKDAFKDNQGSSLLNPTEALSGKFNLDQENFLYYTEEQKAKIQEFNNWLDGLSDKEKEIVIRIVGEDDHTLDWTLNDFKNALTNWEIPEEEKFHFSDLFADEDFKTKVGDYKDKITELDNALKDLQNKNTSESDKNKLFLNLSDKFPELTGQADNLEESISNLIESLESDAIEYFNEQLEHMATEEDVASINNLKNTLLGLATTAHGIENIKDKIDELKTSLGNLKSTYDSIKSVISDYNNNGYLTLDNLQSIMSLEPEYINLLINENGQINLNSQAYKNYVTSKAKSLLVNELKDLYGTVLNMKQEEAQAYANAKAYDEETRSVKDLLTATTQLYIDKARAKDSVNGNTIYMDALTRSFGTAANYAAMVDDYINSLSSTQNEFSNVVDSTTSALDGEKESLEANKKALEDEKNALEDTKKSLEDYKNELSDAQNNLKDFIDLVTDYIKQIKDDEKSALKDQIEALNKQKEALDESKNKYADVIDKKKEALKLAKEEKEAAEELANKQKSVAKDRLALEVAGLDDSSAGKKAQKQARDNLASSEKDLSNYLADQSYEKQVAELDDLQKRFEESIEKRKVAIDGQVEYINSKIDEIDQYLDNSRRLYEDACKMIDADNGALYSNLWNYTYTYTTNTKAEFDYMWTSAQEALQKYRGENDSLIGVMETLQSEIYNTENQISYLNSQINDLDVYIDNVSRSIDNVSNAISNQSNDVDGLASSWNNATANALAYKRALDDTANNTNTNNNGIPSNAKWTFDYYKNGKKYTAWSTHSNYSDAAEAIIAEIQKNTGQYRPDVYGGMKRYASGTRHTTNPLSLTQENGLEALFVKNPNGSGSYTLTTPDSQVFDHQRTDELYNFSGNPEGYISKLAKKGLSPLSNTELNGFGLWNNPLDAIKFGETVFDNSVLNKNITNGSNDVYNNDNSANNQNITVHMPIQIQGNADSSVTQALNRYKTTFKKEMINELTRIGEKYRR